MLKRSQNYREVVERYRPMSPSK